MRHIAQRRLVVARRSVGLADLQMIDMRRGRAWAMYDQRPAQRVDTLAFDEVENAAAFARLGVESGQALRLHGQHDLTGAGDDEKDVVRALHQKAEAIGRGLNDMPLARAHRFKM